MPVVLSSFSTFKKQSDIATDKSIVLLYCLMMFDVFVFVAIKTS